MMKVILIKDVDGCGRDGDICTVSAGHARNYLLPRGLAVVATDAQIKQQQEQALRREENKVQAQEQSDRLVRILDGKTITLKAKHDNKKLFAAVDTRIIADELSTLVDEDVSVEVIHIKAPIKRLGDHKVELRFNDNAQAKINVHVVSA